ncbi:DUF3953 domain-containing protein [Bacillus salacetis]|uniref:DUF3953 domain-containing protein n=1 Tax=Bacillus salacetis TaxID=2315464 RepID=UPI003B9EEB5D
MKKLRKIISAAALVLAVYGFITSDFTFNFIMIFLLGLSILIMGIEEFRKERKGMGILLFVTFLFLVYSSIQGFLVS